MTSNITAIGAPLPLPVTEGGTGVDALSPIHGILAAGSSTTSDVAPISPQTAGFVLTSNGTGAAAEFKAPTGTKEYGAMIAGNNNSQAFSGPVTVTFLENGAASSGVIPSFASGVFTINSIGVYELQVTLGLHSTVTGAYGISVEPVVNSLIITSYWSNPSIVLNPQPVWISVYYIFSVTASGTTVSLRVAKTGGPSDPAAIVNAITTVNQVGV